jgi:hypothetical protein
LSSQRLVIVGKGHFRRQPQQRGLNATKDKANSIFTWRRRIFEVFYKLVFNGLSMVFSRAWKHFAVAKSVE